MTKQIKHRRQMRDERYKDRFDFYKAGSKTEYPKVIIETATKLPSSFTKEIESATKSEPEMIAKLKKSENAKIKEIREKDERAEDINKEEDIEIQKDKLRNGEVSDEDAIEYLMDNYGIKRIKAIKMLGLPSEAEEIETDEAEGMRQRMRAEPRRRERRVFQKVDELAERYARGGIDGSARGNRIFIEGDKIYSYGHHFVIANRINPITYEFNTRRYSNTTSRQQREVRSALESRGYKIIEREL